MSSDSDPSSFRAWRVDETSEGTFVGSDQTCSLQDLRIKGKPADDTANETTLLRVTHSSLNYKDALSAAGNKGVTRSFPHTPGIDAAGTVVEGGASALVTGFDLGMNTDGGFGEIIRVPSQWVLTPNPFDTATSSLQDASSVSMVYGTAGLTAALCVQRLLEDGKATPADGKIVVTGASGGVGSVSVEILAKLGFEVVAVSGKASSQDFLKQLGASEVVGREALAPNKRPLLKPLFAHAIDTVGGSPLAELLKQIAPGGSVAACGNAAGIGLETSVLPFILRGVSLMGVDSAEIPPQQKLKAWEKLANEWRCPITEQTAKHIGRQDLQTSLQAMLKGESSGRIVLDHSLTKE